MVPEKPKQHVTPQCGRALARTTSHDKARVRQTLTGVVAGSTGSRTVAAVGIVGSGARLVERPTPRLRRTRCGGR